MANVNFCRDTKANIDNVAYTDGQMYFPTDQNKIYLDTGNQRKQYGGDTEVDSTLSTTSENPVQNRIVTTSLNQKVAKTDVVNDLASAVAVTDTHTPAGCGTVKELKQNVGALNNSLTIQATTYVGGTSHAIGDYVIDGAGTTASPYTLRRFVTAGAWLTNTEIVTSGVGAIYNNTDGKGYIMGADSVHPFSGTLDYKSDTFIITNNRIAVTKGGYAIKDGVCYVDCEFTLNIAISSSAGVLDATSFPNPGKGRTSTAVISTYRTTDGVSSWYMSVGTTGNATFNGGASGNTFRMFGAYLTDETS